MNVWAFGGKGYKGVNPACGVFLFAEGRIVMFTEQVNKEVLISIFSR